MEAIHDATQDAAGVRITSKAMGGSRFASAGLLDQGLCTSSIRFEDGQPRAPHIIDLIRTSLSLADAVTPRLVCLHPAFTALHILP